MIDAVGLLLALLALVLLGAGIHFVLSALEIRRFPPPGELVDIGGTRIHLHRTGERGPTVILDAALAGTSLSWGDVAPTLARVATVVSYDRAGFGWSDPSPLPRRVDHFVNELRLALEGAGIGPPYILVGHSYGGWIARLFASTYPDEILGLVLVDVPHPREWKEPSAEQKRRVDRGVRLASFAARLAPLGITRALFRLAARGIVVGRGAGSEQGRIEGLLRKVPTALRPVIRSFWVRPGTLRALSSLIEHAPESAAIVDAETRSLGDLPLVVLTASSPSPARLRDQEEVVKLSSRGRHVVAERSGHWIPLDEPNLVIDAVESVVRDAQPLGANASRTSMGSFTNIK